MMTDGICPFADIVLDRATLTGWSSGYVDRVGFCDHTAGGYWSTLTRPDFWNDPDGKPETDDDVTVHFGISKSGKLVQVLNIFDTAFAQGRTSTVSWPPYATMGRRNPNGYLISTEHEDEGKAPIWTPEMYATDLRVKLWCIQEVKRVTGKDLMRFGIDSLAGHHMFDPVNRGGCPGSHWRDTYRQSLYNDIMGVKVPTTPQEDEVFTRMPQNSANPDFWHGKVLNKDQGMAARADFGLSPDVKEIEVELAVSGGLDVMDGDTANGLAFYASGIQHGRVKLDSIGGFWMRPVGTPTIDWIRCVGYYS